EILYGISLIKEVSPRSLDFIMSFGERFSAFSMAEIFRSTGITTRYLDAREVIITDENFNAAIIKTSLSEKLVKEYYKNHKEMKVITGFIGSTQSGITTTLGRGGSDLTASFLGSILNADEIQIWSDTDGVLSADPKKVPKAFNLKELSYEEAMELSHFGAKVLYPPTLQPAREKSIPIRVLNTFNPDFTGTLISLHPEQQGNRYAKGITSIDNVSLLTIQGSGMVGVTGVAARVFSALAKEKINIILISQASSEHSICLTVKPEFDTLAKAAIEREFENEIKINIVDEVVIEPELSVIAIVGEGMRKTPGISGKLFQALGEKRINVKAIAQGSSELNISVVVSKNDEIRALRAIHDAFFSEITTLYLFLVGVGLIGSELLKQIRNNFDNLYNNRNLELKCISMADIKKMLINPEGLNLNNWKQKLQSSKTVVDMPQLIDKIKEFNFTNSVFIDCTASEVVSNYYEDIMKTKTSVVTANKIANTSSYSLYKHLHDLSIKYNVHYLYETNAGAGLPIISTLKDLLDSGDRIYKIEAVLSGTISFIFNNFNTKTKFSEVVKLAKKKGYTEPDPRIDLSGLDIARKLLLLVREIGEEIELDDIEIEPLLPKSCREAKTVGDFFQELEKHDYTFEKMLHSALEQNKVLRYIAIYEEGKTRINLEKVDRSHPFYDLKGSDNIVAFKTSRYRETPLVIKGAGAGAGVTAAGVLGDIFKIATTAEKKRSYLI
ncbi:MAG: bifunctional aspartate kinase/homoserine dehydrogenase I, partial [bacterium]